MSLDKLTLKLCVSTGSPGIKLNAGRAGLPPEIFAGVLDAGVMLFFIRIRFRAAPWIADRPEIVYELIARGIVRQSEESLTFVFRNDVHDVFLDPRRVFFRESLLAPLRD